MKHCFEYDYPVVKKKKIKYRYQTILRIPYVAIRSHINRRKPISHCSYLTILTENILLRNPLHQLDVSRHARERLSVPPPENALLQLTKSCHERVPVLLPHVCSFHEAPQTEQDYPVLSGCFHPIVELLPFMGMVNTSLRLRVTVFCRKNL